MRGNCGGRAHEYQGERLAIVAYSYKARFEAPIRAGTKTQTIRADRKRHARPGEEVQNYYGMRTKKCRLIGRAICMAVSPIRFDFLKETITIGGRRPIRSLAGLDEFARSDGFMDFLEMREFWRKEHGLVPRWDGVLIEWKDFKGEPT